MGYVYFFVTNANYGMMVKIGYTKGHPEKRRREVQGMCPTELDLFAFIKGDMDLEKKLHRTFAPLNYHGEWFMMTNKLRDLIWYILPDGPCKEPTDERKFHNAINDCILAKYSSHPSMTDEEYLASAVMSEWADFFEDEECEAVK